MFTFVAVTSMLPIVLFPTLGILVSEIGRKIRLNRKYLHSLPTLNQSIDLFKKINNIHLGNRQNMYVVYERCDADVYRWTDCRIGCTIL